MRFNKYGAKKTTIDGIKFDSMAEAEYYRKLKILERAGKIINLKLQPTFVIANAYRIDTTKTKSGKSKVGELKYTPDFMFTRDGKQVVVEVKGKITTDYTMRKKLFLACAYHKYGVDVFKEVTRGRVTEYYCNTVKE